MARSYKPPHFGLIVLVKGFYRKRQIPPPYNHFSDLKFNTHLLVFSHCPNHEIIIKKLLSFQATYNLNHDT